MHYFCEEDRLWNTVDAFDAFVPRDFDCPDDLSLEPLDLPDHL